MDLEALRQAITNGIVRVHVSQHARTEAFKDGFTVTDMREAIMAGQIVEEYPGRDRVLLLLVTREARLPMHLVLEHASGDTWATVTTVYLPDDEFWHPGYRTRR